MRVMKSFVMTIGAVALIVLVVAVINAATGEDEGYVYGADGSGSAEDYAAATGDPAPPPAAPAEEVSADSVPEGMYAVGSDIPAGTYRTAGADPSSPIPNCYWERLNSTSGEFDAIITNGNETGPKAVTLKAGEWFSSTGCQPWALVS